MAYEEDKQSDQDPEVTDAEKRLEAMRVELLQVFFDLKNIIDETYDQLETPFVCQYCDELILNKPQAVNWNGNFYHLEKCLVKAARERLSQ